MGLLIDGEWDAAAERLPLENGRFVRRESAFRRWVTADGSSGFKAEPGRYHLYVSYQCPWAHRAILFRRLKGLEEVVGLSVAIPDGRAESWRFGDEYPGAMPDSAEGFTRLHQAYTATRPDYTGIVSVPVLWDRRERVIVNNESAEIIRMLNGAFDAFTAVRDDYHPAPLRDEIDRINDLVYRGVNNGVYRCGFAATQEAYDEACDLVFATLDELEARLGRQRYLVGGRITEADWRLFISLLRFDPVYQPLFRCSVRPLASYHNLSNYMRELYQVPGVAETVRIDHIVRGYYSIRRANPSGIIPKVPRDLVRNLAAPHDRECLAS
jgi:putative glutathione S-transferase